MTRDGSSDAEESTHSSTAGRHRRTLLAGLGTTATLGAAGVVRALGGGDGEHPVSILAAGSLQRALGEGLREAVDVPIRVEAHGSVTAARLVAGGQRDPDVVALADVALFDSLLDAPWYATVATNELVVAHTARPDPHPIESTGRWFDPILDGDVSLGRTDPALDPLGYRTVFAFDLGEAHYDRPGLRSELLGASSIYPETSLVSRLETGTVDAAVLYRSMAVDRGYPSVDLPAAIDLSDPERDYGDARYRLDGDTVVRGAPIRYGAWARRTDERVRRVFGAIADGRVLGEYGFGTPPSLPEYRGTPPANVEV